MNWEREMKRGMRKEVSNIIIEGEIVFEGEPIPEVLTSGDHKRVKAWRRAEAERLTAERRPDLWEAYLTQKSPKKGPQSKG